MARSDNASPRQARAAAVAEHFARLAQSYGGGEYYTRRREAVLRAIRAEVACARCGLDLGCGNGRYLHEFRAMAPKAFFCGADLSPEMLAQARARSGCAVVRADASDLPFRDSVFDLIFASHVLPFVSDIRAVVKGIVRCLAPSGVLAATAGGGGLRTALEKEVGEQQWRRISSLVFSARERTDREGEELHREAFRAANLKLETRTASFEISWSGLEEWVQLRWFPFATEAEKAGVARAFSEIAPRTDRGLIALEERLLLGRR